LYKNTCLVYHIFYNLQALKWLYLLKKYIII